MRADAAEPHLFSFAKYDAVLFKEVAYFGDTFEFAPQSSELVVSGAEHAVTAERCDLFGMYISLPSVE